MTQQCQSSATPTPERFILADQVTSQLRHEFDFGRGKELWGETLPVDLDKAFPQKDTFKLGIQIKFIGHSWAFNAQKTEVEKTDVTDQEIDSACDWGLLRWC